jgi:hypothetical protein
MTAVKRVTIKVNQNDIDRAIRADSSHCVVARAVARSVPDATRIEVDTQTIRFTSRGKRFAFLTPLTVQGYVAAFDAGDPISPFQFQLRDPMELRRKTVKDEHKPQASAYNKAYRERKKAEKENPDAVLPKVSYAGLSVSTSAEGRQAPPRVFKTSKRSYGHRLLRINRPQDV